MPLGALRRHMSMIIRCLAGGGCEMQAHDTKLSNYLVYQVKAEIARNGEREIYELMSWS